MAVGRARAYIGENLDLDALLLSETKTLEQEVSGGAEVWAQLDRHFGHHALLIGRFRHADRAAVLRMWKAGLNEYGSPLSCFERDALVERHCALFGSWPRAPGAAEPAAT